LRAWFELYQTTQKQASHLTCLKTCQQVSTRHSVQPNFSFDQTFLFRLQINHLYLKWVDHSERFLNDFSQRRT